MSRLFGFKLSKAIALIVVSIVALPITSAIGAANCNNDCKKADFTCVTFYGVPGIFMLAWQGNQQGGLWWSTAPGDGNRCDMGIDIDYMVVAGCTPQCVSYNNNSVGGGGVNPVDFRSMRRYGCRKNKVCQ